MVPLTAELLKPQNSERWSADREQFVLSLTATRFDMSRTVAQHTITNMINNKVKKHT